MEDHLTQSEKAILKRKRMETFAITFLAYAATTSTRTSWSYAKHDF